MTDLRQREPRLVIPALTRLAKGKPCMLLIPEFHRPEPNNETTVWAHSNKGEHGKGKGLKAHDCFGTFACFRCHEAIDKPSYLTAEDKDYYMRKGMDRTLYYLFANGHLEVQK